MNDEEYYTWPASSSDDAWEVVRVGDSRRQAESAYDDYEVITVGGGKSASAQPVPAQTPVQRPGDYDDYEVVRVGGSRPQADAVPAQDDSLARQRQAQARAARASRGQRPAASSAARQQGAARQQQQRARQQQRAGQQQRRAAGDRTRTQDPRSAQRRAAAGTRNGARRQAPVNRSEQGGAPAGFVPARQQYSRGGGYKAKDQGMSTGKKAAIVILCVLLLLAAIGAAYYVIKKGQAERDIAGNKTQAEMNAIDAELTGTKTYDGPFNMLLLGSDARSDDPDMGARTDTVMLVRIDPTVNTVSILSIPRDTMITIDGVGTAKFNAAYTYGGVAGTISAVKDLTGADIDHYAEINFEGLVDMVDAGGGVDVYVDELVDDEDAGDVIIEPGEQHLNGEAALTLARSRAYADGDYTRTYNQRKIIMGLAHKLLEAPATELTGLIRNSTKYLTTDMSLDDILSLADQMRHNNDYPVVIYSNHLPSYPTMVGEISYVVADNAGVADIMRRFNAGESIEDEEPEYTADDNTGGADVVDYGYYEETYDETYYTGYADETYYDEDAVYEYYEEDVVYDAGGDGGEGY